MRIILIIIILINAIPALAEEFSLQDFTERVESWIEGLNGVVISSSSKEAVIDLGKDKFMAKGIPFEITRKGEELRHPITNELLGRRSLPVGTGKIIRVESKFSTLLLDKVGAKKGDAVHFNFPLKIKFQFKNMAQREENEIKFNILENKNILEDSAASFNILCERRVEGDTTAICSFKYEDNIIFTQNTAVKGYKIIRTGEKPTADSSFSKIGESKVKSDLSSIAIGYLFGKKNAPTIALATSSKVFIYQYNNDGSLKEVAKIGSFKEILNIEIADIDNDSTDELLISNLDKEKNASSAIYSFNGKKFSPISEKIPLLFRSFYGDSKKTLICQEYSQGAYAGKIYRYFYDKNKGHNKEELARINQTYAKLYGSALTNEKESFKDIIYFNEKGALITQDGANHQYTVDYNFFGETNKFIIIKENIDDGITVGTEGGGKGFFVHDYKSYATFIYQRIIRLNSGAYLMYANIPKKRTEKLSTYASSKIGEYIFAKGKVLSLFEEEVKDSFIAEIDITSNGSLIAYLENGSNGNILKIAKL